MGLKRKVMDAMPYGLKKRAAKLVDNDVSGRLYRALTEFAKLKPTEYHLKAALDILEKVPLGRRGRYARVLVEAYKDGIETYLQVTQKLFGLLIKGNLQDAHGYVDLLLDQFKVGYEKSR